MEIRACGSVPSRRAPAQWFTGIVWQEPIVQAEPPARIYAALVRFDPGARTNWHTHPLGQTLYVVAGSGRVEKAGGPVGAIRAGATVWIPPGERHWHGASSTNAMTHVAMQEMADGRYVDWEEPVSDEEYARAP
jgi:quercetin dioxygenase-like cupin family protein